MSPLLDHFSYVPGFADSYDTVISQIEAAAERAADRVQRERAKLVRPDGSRVYGDAEHAEREQAVYDQVGADFDGATGRYVERAERDAAEAQTTLALLDGFDPYDRLSDAERQAASTRAAFVKEDCETAPAAELVKQARAALASGDKARVYLLNRYLARRIESRRGQPGAAADVELLGVARDLAAAFDDGDRSQKRRALEEKARAAGVLPLAVKRARSAFDGSDERARDSMRRHLAAQF